ncbi:uncharacterized protein LOC141912625 isoform X2 [Tubulanus polymorphus]|uniref:uncharacterized protein LOC141912625 isoform X2 n=1 Tax=Tubulanus polymorphus TaxID=672921 RepID=UPI003DA5C5A8
MWDVNILLDGDSKRCKLTRYAKYVNLLNNETIYLELRENGGANNANVWNDWENKVQSLRKNDDDAATSDKTSDKKSSGWGRKKKDKKQKEKKKDAADKTKKDKNDVGDEFDGELKTKLDETLPLETAGSKTDHDLDEEDDDDLDAVIADLKQLDLKNDDSDDSTTDSKNGSTTHGSSDSAVATEDDDEVKVEEEQRQTQRTKQQMKPEPWVTPLSKRTTVSKNEQFQKFGATSLKTSAPAAFIRRMSLGISNILGLEKPKAVRATRGGARLRKALSMSDFAAASPHFICNRYMSEAAFIDRTVLLKWYSLPSLLDGDPIVFSSVDSPSATVSTKGHVEFVTHRRPSTVQKTSRSMHLIRSTNELETIQSCSSLESINDVVEDVRRSSVTPDSSPVTARQRDDSIQQPPPATFTRKPIFSQSVTKTSPTSSAAVTPVDGGGGKKTIFQRISAKSIYKFQNKSSSNDKRTKLRNKLRKMLKFKALKDDASSTADENRMLGQVKFDIIQRRLSSKCGLVLDPEDDDRMVIAFLLNLSPTIVAEELTMIDKRLFFNIPSSELVDCAWTKRDKYMKAPNIMNLIDFFERIANLVATCILLDETIAGRAKLINLFIAIADRCYSVKNYNSLRAILGGLQLTPIYRLEDTWNHVMHKSPRKYKRFAYLSDFMSHENNYSEYRTALEKALDNPPCLPFIGIFLQTVMALDTAQDVSGLKKKKKKPNVDEKTTESDHAATGSRRTSVYQHAKDKMNKLLHLLKDEDEPFDPNNNADSDDDEQTVDASSSRNTSQGSRHHKLSIFDLSDDDLSDDDGGVAKEKPAFMSMKPKDMLFHYQIAALEYNYAQNDAVREFLLRAQYKTDEENYRVSLQREPKRQ